MLIWIFVACVGGGDTGKDSETGGGHTADTAPVPFACGEETCDARTQYCDSAVGGQPDTSGEAVVNYSCVSLPAACADTPTCACLEGTEDWSSGSECREEGGALFVTTYLP